MAPQAPDDWRNKAGKLVYNAKKGEYTKHATATEKKYGERLSNAGEYGKKSFDRLVNSKHKTKVVFNDTDDSLVLGKADVTLNEDKTKIIESEITIYLKEIENEFGEIKEDSINTDEKIINEGNLTSEDLGVATFGHEIAHNTLRNAQLNDDELNSDPDADTTPYKGQDKEYVPNMITTEILKAIKDEK